MGGIELMIHIFNLAQGGKMTYADSDSDDQMLFSKIVFDFRRGNRQGNLTQTNIKHLMYNNINDKKKK